MKFTLGATAFAALLATGYSEQSIGNNVEAVPADGAELIDTV